MTLALGVLLPGSRPSGRERPMRRAGRSGWSARSVSSGAWVVPDQESGSPALGTAGGDRDDHDAHAGTSSLRTALGLPGHVAGLDADFIRVGVPPAGVAHVAGLFRLSPSSGRAPPVSLS